MVAPYTFTATTGTKLWSTSSNWAGSHTPTTMGIVSFGLGVQINTDDIASLTLSSVSERAGVILDVSGDLFTSTLNVSSGKLDVLANGLVDVTSTFTGTGALTVESSGTLAFDTAPTGNTIGVPVTLGLGGHVDFSQAVFAGHTMTETVSGNAVTLSNGFGQNITLESVILPTGDVFQTGTEKIGSTTYNFLTAVTCFRTGTMIATADGEMPVEALTPGTLLRTADGAVMPVRWLGRTRVSRRFADPARVLPVRIKAGALGENLPARDLLVSPGHAIFLDGVLVNAAALVNGVTITRDHAVPEVFDYWHVELDTHALILAEGCAAESFPAEAQEMAFDNWAERVGPADVRELPYARCKSPRQLPRAVRARITTTVAQAA